MKQHQPMQFFNFGFLFLLRLIARSYFYTFALPVVNFFLPIIIGFICYEILPMELLGPGLIIHPVLTVGMLSLPLSLGSGNESVIIRRLKLSNIPMGQVLFGFFFFYFAISLAGLGNMLLFFYAYSEAKLAAFPGTTTPSFQTQLQNVKYGEFLAGTFLVICLSLAIGLLISYSTFRFQSALFIGLSFYLTQSFLTGVFLSLDLIVKIKAMLYLSYASPIFPALRIVQAAGFEEQIGKLSTNQFAFETNGTLIVNQTAGKISFSDQYGIHALGGLGNLGVVSTITTILFMTYKPR